MIQLISVFPDLGTIMGTDSCDVRKTAPFLHFLWCTLVRVPGGALEGTSEEVLFFMCAGRKLTVCMALCQALQY